MRNTTLYIIFLALPLLILIDGCIEPYKPVLDKNDSEFILVVEGLITNQQGSFEIKLSRSVPVDTAIHSFPERGAFVMVTDDRRNTFDFYEDRPGIYRCTDNTAKAMHGREYQLNITDSEGENYESSLVKMEPTPEIKHVYWSEVTKDVFVENEVFQEHGINIYVEGDEPESEVHYYKWDFAETWEVEMPNNIIVDGGEEGPVEVWVPIPPEKKFCWVTRESADVLIKSVVQQQNSKIDSFLITHIPEETDLLHIKYSIEVSQYSLSKEMYDFWEKIKEFNEDIGTMYDQIPYPIYGNIVCCSDENKKVLGYFDAAEVKTKRIFIDNEDHPLRTVNSFENCVYFTRPNPYHFVANFYGNTPFCADCRNSGSSVKPDFWD